MGVRKRGREMRKGEGRKGKERKKEREKQNHLQSFTNYSSCGVALQVISLELS